MKKLLLSGASAAIAGALTLGQADPAHALAIQVIYDGVLQYQVNDNGAGDASDIAGHLQHSNIVGVFGLGTASVLTSHAFGAVDYASLGTTVHATTVSPSAGTHTLEILASETDFTAPDPSTFWNLLSDFGVSVYDDSFIIETYIDFGNGLFATTQLVHSGDNTTPNVEDPFHVLIPEDLTEVPFSITHRIIITHTGEGESLISNRTTVTTPEPMTVGLFGLGMLGLGAVARRRKA